MKTTGRSCLFPVGASVPGFVFTGCERGTLPDPFFVGIKKKVKIFFRRFPGEYFDFFLCLEKVEKFRGGISFPPRRKRDYFAEDFPQTSTSLIVRSPPAGIRKERKLLLRGAGKVKEMAFTPFVLPPLTACILPFSPVTVKSAILPW